MAASYPFAPCLASEVLGEWRFQLGAASPLGGVADAFNCTPTNVEWSVSLRQPNIATRWVPSLHGGFEPHIVPGTFVSLGMADGVEISVDSTTFSAAFTTDQPCKGAKSFTGTFRDSNAELWGCFTATRRDDRSLCADSECHGAAATASITAAATADATNGVSATLTRRLRLGSKLAPARVLRAPTTPDSLIESSPPPLSEVIDAEPMDAHAVARAAALINASAGLLWNASASGPLTPALVHGLLAPAPLPTAARAASAYPLGSPNSTRADGAASAALPKAVDWRSGRASDV